MTTAPETSQSLVKRTLDLADRIKGDTHDASCERTWVEGGYRMTPCSCESRRGRLDLNEGDAE